MTKSNQIPPDWERIVLQLKEAAKEKNISQTEISEGSGMLPSSISRIFSCEFPPKLSTLVTIADIIGVTININ